MLRFMLKAVGVFFLRVVVIKFGWCAAVVTMLMCGNEFLFCIGFLSDFMVVAVKSVPPKSEGYFIFPITSLHLEITYIG